MKNFIKGPINFFTEEIKDAVEDSCMEIRDAFDLPEKGLSRYFASVIGSLGVVLTFLVLLLPLFLLTLLLVLSWTVIHFLKKTHPEIKKRISTWLNEFIYYRIIKGLSCIYSFFGLIAHSVLVFLYSLGHRKKSNIPPSSKTPEFDHLFVLMLENRSFDHLLGFLDNPKINGSRGKENEDLDGNSIKVKALIDPCLPTDPPHEFAPVQLQLNAGTNNGFAKVWQHELKKKNRNTTENVAKIMATAAEKDAPVLYKLAREFAVCDKWFSSVPGPTVPNRLFAMAGTSGRLANSPKNFSLIRNYVTGFQFKNGTIFRLLDQNFIPWRIYKGGPFPIAHTLKGIFTSPSGETRQIRPRKKDDFTKDLTSAGEKFPAFTFIEPDYGHFWRDFKKGNSQHPTDGIGPGEMLIKHVYETLRKSPIWERSLLVITYDEHGGFHDHVKPPEVTPPGDETDLTPLQECEKLSDYKDGTFKITFDEDDLDAFKFNFDRLGIRVPTVIVSPLIDRGTVPEETFDHTSIIKTITERFNIPSLTQRDQDAASIASILNREIARNDTPEVLPDVDIRE